MHVTLIAFLVAVVASTPVLRGSGRDLDYAAQLRRVLGNFVPPDFSVLGATLASLLETVQIAVMATLIAILMALPFSIAASRNLAPFWLVAVTRLLANLIRTIPSLVWALVAVAIVGTNPLAGVIGLAFYSLGYLAKFYSDAFESVDAKVAEGLQAMGAGRIQAFQHGLWPHAQPLVWSHSLWMLEYNIRAASIIGYVGAGGIGVQLHTYYEFGHWSRVSTVLLCLLVVVTTLDILGEKVRATILSSTK
jgi:phosphonate transport system permease protein